MLKIWDMCSAVQCSDRVQLNVLPPQDADKQDIVPNRLIAHKDFDSALQFQTHS